MCVSASKSGSDAILVDKIQETSLIGVVVVKVLLHFFSDRSAGHSHMRCRMTLSLRGHRHAGTRHAAGPDSVVIDSVDE